MEAITHSYSNCKYDTNRQRTNLPNEYSASLAFLRTVDEVSDWQTCTSWSMDSSAWQWTRENQQLIYEMLVVGQDTVELTQQFTN